MRIAYLPEALPAVEQSSAHVLSHLCAFWQSAVQKTSEREKKHTRKVHETHTKRTRKQRRMTKNDGNDEPQKSSLQLSTPWVTLETQANLSEQVICKRMQELD